MKWANARQSNKPSSLLHTVFYFWSSYLVARILLCSSVSGSCLGVRRIKRAFDLTFVHFVPMYDTWFLFLPFIIKLSGVYKLFSLKERVDSLWDASHPSLVFIFCRSALDLQLVLSILGSYCEYSRGFRCCSLLCEANAKFESRWPLVC